MKKERVALVIFVLVTLGAGFLGVLMDSILTEQPEGNSLGMGLWLVLPLLTGIICRLFLKEWKTLGLGIHVIRDMKWYLVAICIFPVITVICVLCGVGIQGIQVKTSLLSTVPSLFIAALIGSGVKNIFEEFSWRGHLVPFLEKNGVHDYLLYVVSGLIWGSWHIAYYLFFLDDSYFTTISRPGMVAVGIIVMIVWSPLFVELYHLTGSVWPCVILHTLEDAVPTLLFATSKVLQIKPQFDWLFNPINGILPNLLMLAIGLWLRHRRMKSKVCSD